MKVLTLLSLLLVSSSLLANENNASLDVYLSDLKKKQFDYDYEKNNAESSKLRDTWIAPIELNYSYSKSNPNITEQTNQSAAIKMNQPIFQSGGIYYGIKYANAMRLYNDYTIDVAKRKMIKDTVSILMQLKKSELQEKRQILQIKNADINLEQKKEEYLSGRLDSGFLDDAIYQRNLVKQALFDIQNVKEKLVAQFQVLSDLDYKEAPIPHLELIKQEEFLKNNIVLKQTDAQIEKDRYYKNVTIAKYLPKVNFTAGYNWQKSEGQKFYIAGTLRDSSREINYYDYGISASMPLDINMFNDIESIKYDYLKSQVVKVDKQLELTKLFEQVFRNLDNLDKKISLSKENVELYTKLLSDTQDLYDAGYKTEYDVENLQNSLEIQKIDAKVYEIDKQLELLALYEMYVNNGE
ncbi:TolC family protein [Sulfurimonas sp. C5]|uniref:TolC family protein n=1 Tax=Sulfurimonas sp. C5 TaxID=3036947 RepID=UPI0024544E38|nr:TolC family protein [Sulfurimonas sp. C5]MDH4944165.1 TolC family protein [Sulfurimonas sp. C5]